MKDVRKKYIQKERCTLRGDLQEKRVDFESEKLYAPLAGHESTRIILALSASRYIYQEGCDISNAYLYGSLDVPITMNHVCILETQCL